MPSSPAEPDRLPRRSFAILFGVSLLTAAGNIGLVSVLPAISRSTGVPDEAAVAIFALSAIFWAFCAPMWARLSDKHGRKPLIMVGMAGFTISKVIAALVVLAGLAHISPWVATFVGLLMARGLFGFLGGAANPATQAYLAEYTPPERRTAAIANLAGAWSLGTVIGPLMAPLMILPVVGLSGPLFGFALMGLILLIVVMRWLPESERRPAYQSPEAATAAGKAAPMWRDQRLRPFLIYGFLSTVCQTAQMQVLGFLVIDKMKLSPVEAQGLIAVALMFGAIAGLVAQLGVIRFFRLGARDLIRWGVVIAALGNVLVAFSPGYAAVVVGFSLSSLGFGLSRPGFTAGASLAVRISEQARAAGAIALVNGANGLLAPIFVALYRHAAWGPFMLNATILGGLFAYALMNARLRNADVRSDDEASASA